MVLGISSQALDEVCGCLWVCVNVLSTRFDSRSDQSLHMQPTVSYRHTYTKHQPAHIHNSSVLAAMSLLRHKQCQKYTLSKMLPISTLRMNLICCYLLLRLASEQCGCSTGPLSGTPRLSQPLVTLTPSVCVCVCVLLLALKKAKADKIRSI